MKEKIYVDRLFADYDDTPEIRDFKEEIAGNLKERVKEHISKGLCEDEAFNKAADELGDITAIADDISKRKRNEAIGQMYMGIKKPISAKRGAMYALCGLVLGLTTLIPLLTWFFTDVRSYAIAALLPFGVASVLGFVYLGLTQETTAHEAMGGKRALLYVLAAGLILFGVVAALLMYFSGLAEVEMTRAQGLPEHISILGAIGVLLVFSLSGTALGIFLILTEKDRKKPWLKALVERDIESSMKFHTDMVDPVKSAKFGVLSGGLWILAIAVFFTLGLIIGWAYSWLVFLFAFAIQVFMITMIFEKRK